MIYIFNIRFLLYLIIFNAVFLLGFSTSDPLFWKSTQYLFSYSDEFVKRGFIGTLFDLLNISVTINSIIIFSFFVANLFFIFFYTLLFRVFGKNSNIFNLILILFMFSPLTIVHFGYDIGRLDLINLLLFTLIILLFISENIKNRGLYIGLIVAIALLIHEAFLFIHLPIILAIALYENHKNNFLKSEIFIILLFSFIVLISLFLFGKADYSATIEQVKQHEIIVSNPEVSKEFKSALKVWTWSISDNFKYTKSFKIPFSPFVMILPLIFLYFYLFRKFVKNEDSFQYKILFFSFLGIYPLFLLGIDYDRWTALTFINIFIIFTYLTFKNDLAEVSVSKTDKIIIIFILLHFFIGPMQTASFYLKW